MNKQLLKITIIAAVLFALAGGAAHSVEKKGKVEKVSGITVLTVEGTPYEMGFQQGSLLKEDITTIYNIYLKEKVLKVWVKEYSILGKGGPKAYSNPRGALLEFAKKSEKHIPAELVEEMKGLADGAGLKYEDVLIMSSHIDYFAVLCSTFVARGAATKDGKLVEGRNLDWAQGGLKELDKYAAVIVFKPDNGLPFVSIGYPGIVGVLTGINGAGLAAELNFSMAVSGENGPDGFPALVLMRKLIQNSSTIGDAEKFLRGIQKMAGYNVVAASASEKDARVVEITAKTVGTVPLVNDTLVSTNHFMSKELAGKNTNASGFSSSPSPERYARLVQLLKDNRGKIDPAAAMKMMHDGGVQVPGTVQTVVISPETGDFWFWARGRAQDDYVKFNVKDLLK